MLHSRSRTAFGFSADRLPVNRKGHLYLWTWTFAELVAVPDARKRWSVFLKKFRRMKKYFGFQGLRVFEMHGGGHGLHIHVITANYLFVNDVRALWRSCGGGRIDVQPIPFERRHYIGKYLSKSGRPECLKGARLWDTFGGLEAVRCKDIEYQSDWTCAYKALVVMVEGFAAMPYRVKQYAVANVLCGRKWCLGLGDVVQVDQPWAGPSYPDGLFRERKIEKESEACLWS